MLLGESIQSKHQQGFLMSKLVSENSLPVYVGSNFMLSSLPLFPCFMLVCYPSLHAILHALLMFNCMGVPSIEAEEAAASSLSE